MRFPKYHLATSVVNRIMQVADRVQRLPVPTAPPVLPNVAQQGMALDNALSSPPQSVPAPVGSEEAVMMENMAGGSAADAITGNAIMDEFA